MSFALRQSMTPDEFLQWEEQQEERYEYDGFGPVAMAGAREAHSDIQVNLIAALHSRLRGRDCRVYGSETKISASGSFRYPDALIVCGPRDATRLVALDPVVIFEIVSGSTAGTDRVTKYFEYCNTPSVQRYVIIEQTVIGAEVFARSDGWAGRVQGQGSVLAIPEAGIELALDELYDGLDLSRVSSKPA